MWGRTAPSKRREEVRAAGAGQGRSAAWGSAHASLHRPTIPATGPSLASPDCHAVNTGSYVMLPTPGGIAMFEGWAAAARDGISKNEHDQQYLDHLTGQIWRRCTIAKWFCNLMKDEARAAGHGSRAPAAGARGRVCVARVGWQASTVCPPTPHHHGPQIRQNNQTGRVALIRAYLPGFFMYSDDVCSLNNPSLLPLMDTCDWTSELARGEVCARWAGERRRVADPAFHWPACRRSPVFPPHLYRL